MQSPILGKLLWGCCESTGSNKMEQNLLMTVRQLESVLNEKKLSISLFTDKICDKKQQQQ